ncbi:MAG: ABC transporter ATP-binding protein [Magnetospirillum sp.]|nr:ABC transporter ATP-binding protein [Magnetospirillum sp.]
MREILKLEGVSKNYGAVTVANDITYSVMEGEAVGIIGPNGAGKTTMFNMISGDVRPNIGHVQFEGQRIDHLPPSARCHRGIGRSYQVPHPFTGMTVLENVLVGGTYGAGMPEREAVDHCISVLERTGLHTKMNTLAGSLTLLDRKRLELARALSTKPKLLLLDEIAGGLTEHEVHALVDMVKSIHAEGISIIWIEHIVHALMAVVDRLIVLNFGRLLKNGDPKEVMESEEVREIYMGIELQ